MNYNHCIVLDKTAFCILICIYFLLLIVGRYLVDNVIKAKTVSLFPIIVLYYENEQLMKMYFFQFYGNA